MRRGLVVTVLGLLVFAQSSLGWWGFVHYRVAKEIADTVGGVDPNYSMGPDTFPSYERYFLIIHEITPEFLWSHATLATDLDVVPDAPQYPHDGRYPGRVMYDLLTNKLRPSSIAALQGPAAYEQNPMETAKGFVVHNAADNIVHWDYFLGGNSPAGCPGIAYLWETNHLFKEEWASYIVLMLKDARDGGGTGAPIQLFRGAGEDNMMGTIDDIFSSLTEDANLNGVLDPGEDQDGSGTLTDFTGEVFGPVGADGHRHLLPYLLNLHPISYKANAKLMHLAMEVHRKNRRNTDVNSSGGESSEFAVKSVADIVSSFSTEITGAAMQELNNMTLGRFIQLNLIASDVNKNSYSACAVPGWYPNDVMVRYGWCVQRGIAWLANIGQ